MSYNAEREAFARRCYPPPPPAKHESLRGPGFSSLVVKGFVLAGCNPGNTPAEIAHSLTPVLRAGVTTFVCLENEMPRPGSTVATARSTYGGSVVLSAKPYLAEAQAIVDAGGFPQSGSHPLNFIHLPIGDANGATVPDDVLKLFILDLVAFLKAGEYLYLQCKDGNGRSGTIGAVLLGLIHNMTGPEALNLMQRARGDRAGAFGNSPETHEQKMQVHRLLSDRAFVAAAAGVAPRHPNSAAESQAGKVEAVLEKIRGVLSRRGATSLIYLRRYAVQLVTGANPDGPTGGSVSALAAHAAALTASISTVGVGHFMNHAVYSKLCADAQWWLTEAEKETLWAAVAPEGTVEVAHFVRFLRGQMNKRRATLVHDTFRRLSGGSSHTTMDVLTAAFQAATHPDVKTGKRSIDEVTIEFLDSFGVGTHHLPGGGTRPGPNAYGGPTATTGTRGVSATEWEEYYSLVSAAIADDAQFELLLFGCWPPPVVPVKGLKIAQGKAAQAVVEASAASALAAVGFGGANPSNSALAAALTNCHPDLAAAATRNDRGSIFMDLLDLRYLGPAFRAFCAGCGPLTIAHLGATMRRHDTDRDGCVALKEFKDALKDAGIPLPDGDAELAFRAVSSSILGVPAGEIDLRVTPVPLERAHALLRGPLNEARRTVVVQLFNEMDSEGMGAVPLPTMLVAFSADHHPAVAAGRADPVPLMKAFQEALGEAFRLSDAHGPGIRAAAAAAGGDPAAAAGVYGAALEAYTGQGDGLVRLPFFEAFHEGLSAAFTPNGNLTAVKGSRLGRSGASGLAPGSAVSQLLAGHIGAATSTSDAAGDDAGFTLMVYRVWMSGSTPARHRHGGSRVGLAKPSLAYSETVAAARVEPGEEGLLSNLARLGLSGQTGTGAHHATITAAGSNGPAPGGGAGGPSLYRRGSSASAITSHGLSSSGAADAMGMGPGAVFNPTPLAPTAVATAAPAALTVGSTALNTSATVVFDLAPVAPTGDRDLDAVLGAIRAILQRRGPRGLFRLVKELEGAAAIAARVPRERLDVATVALPAHAFAAVMRDASLGLSQRQLDVLLSKLPRGSGGGVSLIGFLRVLRGVLPQARADVVAQAYAHIAARASSPSGIPVLEDVRMLFRSGSHPEVKSRRRVEEEVLREFLETFEGPSYVAPDGSVSLAGFKEYYANAGLFIAADPIFVVTLFDVWGLHIDGGRAGIEGAAHAADAPAAGRPTAYYGPDVPASPAARRNSGILPMDVAAVPLAAAPGGGGAEPPASRRGSTAPATGLTAPYAIPSSPFAAGPAPVPVRFADSPRAALAAKRRLKYQF